MSCPTPDCPTTGLVLYDTSANVTYGNTALLALQHRVDPKNRAHALKREPRRLAETRETVVHKA